MQLQDQNIVVTGAGGGIGAALVRRFAQDGPRTIVLADVDGAAAQAVVDELEPGFDTVVVEADLGTEAGNVEVVRAAEEFGPVDLLCLNAGIAVGGGVEAPDEDWYRIFDINVMAHVWAVRAALPGMLAQGSGYILTTASAAGLLTNLGAAPYAVTKHAAVALAEWLAITHGDAGIKVSCLCPQGVRTKMLFPDDEDLAKSTGAESVRMQGVIEPDELAEVVAAGLADERFLILPHPEVLDYWRRKTDDYDRWIGGMRKLQARTQG
ncbi:SDR family oxidoreductase [Acidimicrobiia bacterium EGI L10123]|uniref:SDR family oxidoreductase n=1 Tax=Salinilacustrithrix flava TaxID=2957203 RepID=UPI003D7C3004|nr:SDR family oxidoreductase [Acidimicrobiia bacterium EGI L10123]